jgi:hypothetical protein
MHGRNLLHCRWLVCLFLIVVAGPVRADDGCLGASLVETAALPLLLDLDTTGQPDRASSFCTIELGAPDIVVAVAIDTAQVLRISATPAPGFDVLLYMRALECDDPTAELLCSDVTGPGGVETFQLLLTPGNYYIYADGPTAADHGPVTIEVAGVLPVSDSTWGGIKAAYRHSSQPEL